MKASLVALEITVFGTVQGVGFRPFVFNLARELGISGSVRNSGGKVVIVVSGNAESIEFFLNRLKAEAPALAQVDSLAVQELPEREAEFSGGAFSILDSEDSMSEYFMVPPDTALCGECEAELGDTNNRRYGYPFINCTDCGPRFTIIKDLPYDRRQTTMSGFEMCEECNLEFRDPANRRFHAQPNGCWQCGPKLAFVNRNEAAARALIEESERVNGSEHVSHAYGAQHEAASAKAVHLIKSGGIVALKSLGGFQLVCDARNEVAVRCLRERKRRSGKPFAVMFPDVESVEKMCELSDAEMELLTSNRRPIVLLRCKPVCREEIAASVTNGSSWLGVMLPYTPLHALLLKAVGGPIVATSGNVSEEPIAIDNAEALIKLQGIADGFLLHNREIETRFDDSVTAVVAEQPVFIRRARGYAPQPVILPMVAEQNQGKTVLALGGHFKNTFCLLRGDRAYLSQHIGNLNNIDTFEFFEETIWKYQQLFRMAPDMVACDLHPEYLSTQLADRIVEATNLPIFKIQHHHAHIASCMAENGLSGPVLGLAFDGSGFGADGTMWGGEFLFCDYVNSERVGSLQPFPLPGGDAINRHPWKVSVSLLDRLSSSWAAKLMSRYEEDQGKNPVTLLRRQIGSRVHTINSTSTGRLFDAISSILGYCHDSTYDIDAPMRLESAAWKSLASGAKVEHLDGLLQMPLIEQPMATDGRAFLLDTTSIIDQICDRMMQGREPDDLALAFHRAFVDAVVAGCRRCLEVRDIRTVCLSGGVFQNRLLNEMLISSLRQAGFEPFVQRKVPCNDGGLALGQSVVALARSKN